MCMDQQTNILSSLVFNAGLALGRELHAAVAYTAVGSQQQFNCRASGVGPALGFWYPGVGIWQRLSQELCIRSKMVSAISVEISGCSCHRLVATHTKNFC